MTRATNLLLLGLMLTTPVAVLLGGEADRTWELVFGLSMAGEMLYLAFLLIDRLIYWLIDRAGRTPGNTNGA
jgi:hypothetical protein